MEQSGKGRRSGQNFIAGAAILSVAGVLVKIVSACFKIPLTNLLGAQAMSYFNTAYTVYNLLVNLSTVGLSVAVARCIAEYAALGRAEEERAVISVANRTFGLIGLALGLVFFLLANPIAAALQNPGAAPACRALSPALLFVALLSVNKGFFQGHGDMVPLAVSNLIEVLVKLVAGLGLSWLLLQNGMDSPSVVGGAVAGVSLGAFFSMLYLFVRKLLAAPRVPRLPRKEARVRGVWQKFVRTALPVTLGALTGNLAGLIDLGLVMRRLVSSGMSVDGANTLYGAYSAMSLTVFNMPLAIVLSVGVAALPAVSAAAALRDSEKTRRTVSAALKLTSLFSLPCAVGMSALSGPILRLLFTRAEEVPLAETPLAILGVAFFFMGMASVATPLLQALGRPWAPVRNLLLAAAVKIACNFWLVPLYRLEGAAFSNLMMYLALCALNLLSLRRAAGGRSELGRSFFRPLGAALLCGAAAWGSQNLLARLLPASAATILAVLLGAAVYVAAVLAFRILRAEDLAFLPKSKKIKKILEKKGWIG